MGCRYFILKVVEDTWVQRLRDPYYIYTRVALRYLLDLISTHSDGIERANIVAMFSIVQDPRVPEFINRFYNSQKKATRAYLPITNDWMDAMATSALLLENPDLDGLENPVSPLHSSMKR